MLTKGLKNERQNQLNQILRAGLQLAFVPELWNLQEKKRVDEILRQTTELPLAEFIQLPVNDLIRELKKRELSYSNLEYLADLLLKTATVEENAKSELAQKAIAIYNFAQEDSKIFSFTIPSKIEKARKLIDRS